MYLSCLLNPPFQEPSMVFHYSPEKGRKEVLCANKSCEIGAHTNA
jgi:hypothetical protein